MTMVTLSVDYRRFQQIKRLPNFPLPLRIAQYCAATIVLMTSLLLSGCQLFNHQAQQPATDVAPVNIEKSQPSVATVAEIFDAITIDALADNQNPEQQTQPIVYDDLWMKMQNQLSLEVPQNRKVIAQRNWYAKHQAYLDRVATRAEPFLYFIVSEIEKRQMPIELALLPIVESAFDPFAYSHGRASGMWQFIPGTAKRFGLKNNWWYDGRRDVIASTRSALDYLSFLHKTLEGDWLNAIAAYNSGEGRVLRAIKRNKRKHLPTDFWSLNLPRETSAYVPKLLALADLLKRPDEFNIRWKPIANQPKIVIIDAQTQIDIALAAKMADIPVGELHGLNPGYSQWATAPQGPHTFIIPIEKKALFEQQLAATPPKQRLSWQRYQIKVGDSLIKIANQFNTTPKVIRAVNNLSSDMIRQGKHLLIPVAAQDPHTYQHSASQRLIARQQQQAGSHKIEYQVKKGDTLWDIARAHQVNIRKLAKWNHMAPKDPIHPQQQLVIWKTNPSDQQPTSGLSTQQIVRAIVYQVRSGDSLAKIANKFSILINDIIKWNKLESSQYLQPGQKLKLYVDVTKA